MAGLSGGSRPAVTAVWTQPHRAHHAEVMSAGAELTAVSSSLEELTRRVSRIISELSPLEQERYENGLLEVERTLGVASRKLDRVVTGGR